LGGAQQRDPKSPYEPKRLFSHFVLCYGYHMAKLVYNIEPASPSMISSLDRHCLTRVPDGSSNIVPARSKLNRILEGDERGLMQSLRNLYDRGVQKPTEGRHQAPQPASWTQ